MELSLVKALHSDFDFLLTLRLKTMDEHLKNAGLHLTEAQHRARVNEKFECSHIIIWNAEKIGLVKYEMSAFTLIIYQIQILPEYQGRGLGARVLKDLMTKTDSEKVCLTVLKDNPAFRLYKSLEAVDL